MGHWGTDGWCFSFHLLIVQRWSWKGDEAGGFKDSFRVVINHAVTQRIGV